MLNVLVAEVGLQGACVVPLIGQRVSASMTQHMRVRLEPELGLNPGSLDHASEASRGELVKEGDDALSAQIKLPISRAGATTPPGLSGSTAVPAEY